MSKSDELDELFDKTINAKVIAVNVAKDEDEFSSVKDVTEKANRLLDRFRDEFKQELIIWRDSHTRIKALEARIDEMYILPRDGDVRKYQKLRKAELEAELKAIKESNDE